MSLSSKRANFNGKTVQYKGLWNVLPHDFMYVTSVGSVLNKKFYLTLK